MNERRVQAFPAEPQKPQPNDALRQIAGRIKSLTYRDMVRLAEVMLKNDDSDPCSDATTIMVGRLLLAADTLANETSVGSD